MGRMKSNMVCFSDYVGTSKATVRHLAIQYGFETSISPLLRLILTYRRYPAHQTRPASACRKKSLMSFAVLKPCLATMT